ncbi:MAG TPA: tRNA (adenosine(37)-N6)-threonylcarbamoyltransferase complex ATPase subunit type 1 TsaE [Weissella thailandensis]|uniref:tRNA threonylcarbamoyladenosine biosynthesis protein TsaE n=1 Tax=Weissella thailandensis fsh4-2 TaxID=1056112 RepID=G0UE94_9LACO|nr:MULTISPECIES: tRNA (adenosine(37)-N6)-threonylcarbamoyltransferase complex ATPase subunit type 1 TsaE [Weissella]CCC56036.1 ATP-binding protein [Weissella thailandensis fsh4-2]HJG84365.1 tRNA (adenosine(37)-N6)-threonylcarbamoyltransferase complex ATPase subunit type 1 TsaE [Weissella thailandensis]
MRILVNTVNETQKLAAKLAKNVAAGDTILLSGDLGAGKTTFTQGFAKELGIKRPVKSPTFTLVREYQTSEFPLYHLDVYRLGEEGNAEDLGLSEYFGGDAVALVEWSQYIKPDLPDDVLKISFERVASQETQRLITITATGKQSTRLLAAMEE